LHISPRNPDRRGARRGYMRAAVAVSLIALLSACLVSCGKPEKKKVKSFPVIAVAVEARGDLGVRPSGNDFWLAASGGTPVFDGDAIWTGVASNTFLLVPDGCEIAVAENSILEMSARGGRLSRIELARGELWAEGPGDRTPEVGTPAAAVVPDVKENSVSLGVTVHPSGTTTVVAADGGARVENGAGKSTVLAGNSSTCIPGTAPQKPLVVGSQSTTPTPTSLSFLVGLQEDPFFSNKATREASEDQARSRISSAANDAWPHVDLARALVDAGKLAEAREQFELALTLDPQLSQAFAGLGKIYLMEGKWEEAGNGYASARRADPQSLDAVFGMGQAALGRGDLREAEKWYKERLKLDPEGSNPLVGLAVVDLLRLDLDGAVDNLRRAARNEPPTTKAYSVMAIIYELHKDLDQTLVNINKALDVDPGDYGTRNVQGLIYMRQGMNRKAEDRFKQLNDSDDAATQAMGYQNLAAVQQLDGKERRACDNWTKSHDLAPQVQQVLINIGQAHLLLDATNDATAAFSQVVTGDPDNWLPHEWLSRAHLSAGLLQDAAAESREALTLNPSAWISHLVLGLALDTMGDTAGAEAQLDQGQELRPRRKLSASERVLLGTSYQRQGDLDRALLQYRAAAEMAPRDAGNYTLMGDVLAGMKRSDDALREYRKALEIDPSDSQARIKAAALLRSRGDGEDAVKELRRGVEQNPNDALLKKQLAEYLLRDGDTEGAMFQLDAAAATPGIGQGLLADVLIVRGNARDRKEDFAAAIADYQQAITSDPGSGDAWYYLAGDLQRSGRAPDAQAAYRKAVELCRGRPEWKEFYQDAASRVQP
jgi:tetratricopeptide (TPR) repeat protein